MVQVSAGFRAASGSVHARTVSPLTLSLSLSQGTRLDCCCVQSSIRQEQQQQEQHVDPVEEPYVD